MLLLLLLLPMRNYDELICLLITSLQTANQKAKRIGVPPLLRTKFTRWLLVWFVREAFGIGHSQQALVGSIN